MSKVRTTVIGNAAIKHMTEHDIERIMWGDAWSLDSIASLSGLRKNWNVKYPAQVWKRVLDAICRDDRFDVYYVTIDIGWKGKMSRRKVRGFMLKPEWQPTRIESK